MEPKPLTKKDLPDLASVQASMTQVIGLFGHMCSSLNDFNYYKRVTFLSVYTPGHCRELGSFPEPKPLTKKDLPDLASINPHARAFGLFGSMCSSLNGSVTISA